MTSHKELILAVTNESIPHFLRETGYHRCNDLQFNAALQRFKPWIGPRDDLESMRDFKQIIPYVTVTDSDHVLSYHRTTHGGEERLHGMMSIGFGGHIELKDIISKVPEDQTNGIHWVCTLHKCMMRELEEELRPFSITDVKYRGFVAEYESDVGLVHLGVAIEVVTRSVFELVRNDLSIGDLFYIRRSELTESADRMERWSQLLIEGK